MRTFAMLLFCLWRAIPSGAQTPVEFSIFKSFYRPDVTIQWRTACSASETARWRLEAILRREESSQALQHKSLRGLSAPQGVLRFDTSGLPLGRYAIDASMWDASGKIICAQTLLFPVLANPQITSRLVTVRASDNMLIVQGKPFFPLGIYESPATEDYIKKLKEAGFNLCHLSGGVSPFLPKILDTLQAYGLKAWISVSHLLDFSQEAEKKREQLARYVELLGHHRGLLCWESIDEPAWGKQSAEGLYEGYCFLRALDQQHIIWTNHAPRNTIAELAHFNRATDIAGADIYPVPEGVGHSDLPNKTISVVGDETDKNRQAVLGEKPVFMVLQGFGWAELSKPDPKRPPVMPTFKQSRFMAYDAILHGANGLLYWGTHYTKKPSRFWSELRSLISELAALQDILASETLPASAAAQIVRITEHKGSAPAPASRVARPPVRLMHKRHNRFNYLFLINESPEARNVVLSLPPALKAQRWRRLFEGKELGAAKHRLALSLAGYDVAVLSDNLRFADKRKDFSAEWQQATFASASDFLEPGNLLRNPGFEGDADKDGLPDGWAASLAFTAALSAHAHGGKVALQLRGIGGEAAPLAVQRNVEIEAGRKYRFSAWIKTESDVQTRFYVEWHTDTFHAFCLPWTRGTGDWQKLEYEFTALPDPQGQAYAVVQVRGEGVAYFDDVRLELVE